VYRANQKRIELLTLNEKGTAVYGDTEFSDLTDKEFKERYTGLKPLLRRPGTTLDRAVIPNVQLPDEYDWRNYNVVTPVKNQGQCGSCWAFSVTGNVEGLYGIRHGQLISLSEQELVDCDKLDSGCNGGLPENAYKAIKDLGGLESENDYPYNGHENKCKLDRNSTQVQVGIIFLNFKMKSILNFDHLHLFVEL
jgi:cathepsin F